MAYSPIPGAARAALLAACGLLPFVVASPPLSAQAVTGRVVDATTGDPVPRATVRATMAGDTTRAALSAVTDRRGHFILALEPGTWGLLVEHVGYDTIRTAALEVVPHEAVTLEVRLGPRPVAVEPLVVTARRPYAARSQPFYDRMAFYQGRGRFFDRQAMEGYPQVIPVDMWHQTRSSMVFSRCRTTATFVDGVPVPSTHLEDLRLRLEELEGVEIYRSPGTVPHELSTASITPYPDCAVAYWTRLGFYDRPALTPRRAVTGAAIWGALLAGGIWLVSAL
jgi:hypothetical protein